MRAAQIDVRGVWMRRAQRGLTSKWLKLADTMLWCKSVEGIAKATTCSAGQDTIRWFANTSAQAEGAAKRGDGNAHSAPTRVRRNGSTTSESVCAIGVEEYWHNFNMQNYGSSVRTLAVEETSPEPATSDQLSLPP